MTEEEKTVAPETTPADANTAETTAPDTTTTQAETTAAEPAQADDGGNFGEDTADNFGDVAEAAAPAGFEDNFGLGDQQLSAGTIPSPPTAPKKKEAPPVTPRRSEAETLSGVAPGDSSLRAENADGEKPGRKLTREEELFERFRLVRVPERFCQYSVWFRGYLAQHPDALKTLEPMLCDEASVQAVRLGVKRLGAFPTPEFRDVSFYYPMGMATEGERKDWQEHVKRFPEYAKLANGKFPYFDPPQFFYRHGAVFLDKSVTDRLEGGVFYQCGAFCGASLIVMNQYKPAKMYAFEPAEANTVFLQQNVARAGIKNLEMFAIAISDKPGKVFMQDRDREGKPCKTEAPVATLDLFEEKKAVTGRVAWIQADVNGMSLRVVRGAEKMIKRDKPLITVAIY
ncbi:MAG: FkbM family methyltransferase, partial [Lentisphaeria bacterium]|nr:FkbM family methyltransferase [Lentisphaeria bacterium]